MEQFSDVLKKYSDFKVLTKDTIFCDNHILKFERFGLQCDCIGCYFNNKSECICLEESIIALKSEVLGGCDYLFIDVTRKTKLHKLNEI